MTDPLKTPYNDLFRYQFGEDTTGTITGVPGQIYHYGQVGVRGPVTVQGSVSLDETYGSYITVYNAAASVPAGVETAIVTYVVPTGKRFVSLGASGSSNGDAIFHLYIDGVKYATKRNNWCERNIDFNNKIAPLDETIVIVVKALHTCLTARNIEANIYGSIADMPIP